MSFSKCATPPRKQAWSSWNLVPQSCVLNTSLSCIYCLPFQSEGNYAFVNTDSEINSNCFKRGKSGTFWKWHCHRIITLDSKRLIQSIWTWCQITWRRIFYPIQQKSMVFNQKCRWNNGSKSLHSFCEFEILVYSLLADWSSSFSKFLSVQSVNNYILQFIALIVFPQCLVPETPFIPNKVSFRLSNEFQRPPFSHSS